MDVRMPDGTILRGVPDGTPKDEILRKYQASRAASQPEQGRNPVVAAARGFGDAGAFGFQDEIIAGLNTVLPLDRLSGRPVASVWDGKSLSEAYDQNLALERETDALDQRTNKLPRLGGQLVGGIASSIATGGTATGLRGAGIAAGQGAAYGFGSGEDSLADRVQSAALGGAGGVAGYGAGRMVGRMLAPQTAPAARELLDEGVPLTPGQIAGGVTKSIEDRATSLPIVGDAIKSAQRRGLAGFNKAAINRALKPIGKALPEGVDAGYDAVKYAQDELSAAYGKLLPKLTIKADATFADDLANLTRLAEEMPPERFSQFQKIMGRVTERFSKNGTMSGEAMKEAESELGRLIRQYAGSPSGDERLLGDALREAQSQIRQLVERSNPSKAFELKNINRGFANLVRVERAASQANQGIFTPGQLQTATRVLDSSVRKKASAGGGALMQDLAANAREVLPSSVPDSGTAERLLQNILVGGGVGYMSPEALAGGLMAAGAYTRPGQALMTPLLTQRPDAVRAIGGLLGQTSLAVPGGVLATQ